MLALPPLPVTRLGVVTLAELLAAGWTVSGVRHAVRQGRLLRIAAGRFARPPAESVNRYRRADLALARRAVAATLGGDRVALSHLAGTFVRGWPVWAEDPAPCATTWDPRVCRLTGVHLHRVPDLRPLVRLQGLLATSAARTIVDIAREFGTDAAMVSGDAALHHGGITRESLAAEIAACHGLAGIEDLDLEVARWGAPDLRDFTAAGRRMERTRERARRTNDFSPPRWRAFRRDGSEVRRSVADQP